MIEKSDSGLFVERGWQDPPVRDLDSLNHQPRVEVVNDTGLDTETVLKAAAEQNPQIQALQDALVTWYQGPSRGSEGYGRQGTIRDRDIYVNSWNIFDDMRTAAYAVDDDAVASFLDSSEALAFARMEMECADDDEQDIWGQIMDDIDLDAKMRQIWREVSIYGTSVAAIWFGKKSYKVRGKSSATGTKRKKTFNDLTVPLGITTLDPLKCVDAGSFLFDQGITLYIANPTEKDVIDSWLLGDDDSGADEIIKRLIVGKFEPDFRDRKELGELGINLNMLYVLNPKYVFRFGTTKSGFERFHPLRMKSVFPILDLKRQLMAMDRSLLLGGTNYLVLLRKGTDDKPANQIEINNLQQTAQTLAKSSVVVGDHRLSVDIITPKTDTVLQMDRYSGLNLLITGRLFGMFMASRGERDDSLKLARVVARGLESRRLMQKRAFMRKVIMPTFDLNDALTERPDLMFYPKRIALDFDPALATYLLDLRDRGDLSRDSVLAEIDYDEASEAAKRKVEKEKYDEWFVAPASSLPVGTPGVPGVPDAPAHKDPVPAAATKVMPGAPNDPKRAGRSLGGNHGRGGNGGAGRGAGQPPKNGGVKPEKKTGTDKPDDEG